MIRKRFAPVVLGLFCAALLPAQTDSQPGQAATAQKLSFSQPVVSVSNSPALLQDQASRVESSHDRFMRHLWIASMVSAAGASAFDAGTSWGKREGNGLLASSDGTFGARGLSIKAGMMAGVIVPQLITRKHKELRTRLMVGNWAQAGIFTGIAIHNLGVTSSH